MSISPDSLPRRSPIYRRLVEAGARFDHVDDAAVAADFGAPEKERDRARRLGLADLSPLPRSGFKGPAALTWLRTQGVAIGEEDNRSWRQADGALIARLAPSEAVVLDALGAPGLSWRLLDAWGDGVAGCYPVPRREGHAWFAITGAHAPEMFAKLCAVDLRLHKFAPGAVAQTVAARMSTIIVRAMVSGGDRAPPVYHMLGDSAAAMYLWDCLIDAMDEFDGGPVGVAALADLMRSGA